MESNFAVVDVFFLRIGALRPPSDQEDQSQFKAPFLNINYFRW